MHRSTVPLAVLMCSLLCITVMSACAQSRTRGGQESRRIQLPTENTAQTTGEHLRTALVIGNAAYQIAPLRNPVNDATDMAATLKRLGFVVEMLRDADRRAMGDAIKTFSQTLRKGGIGLFYFSGHGVQVRGENYLIPLGAQIDREQDVEFEAVHVGRVLGGMEDAGNGLNLLILDACRDNPFARSSRSNARGLAGVQAATGTLIAYATAPGSVADDGTERNGVYTQHLLRAIASPGLEIGQVFNRVGAAVVQATNGKQRPWIASSLIKDFYFALPDGSASSPPPPPPPPSPPTLVAALSPASPPPTPQVRRIYIDADRDSRHLVTYLEPEIRAKDLHLIQRYDGSPQSLKLVLRTTVATETSRQTKMARLQVNLSVHNSAGDEVFRLTQGVHGSASTDFEDAIKDAAQIWTSTIKQKGVIDEIARSR